MDKERLVLHPDAESCRWPLQLFGEHLSRRIEQLEQRSGARRLSRTALIHAGIWAAFETIESLAAVDPEDDELGAMAAMACLLRQRVMESK